MGVYLLDYLSELTRRTGGSAERIDVEPRRFNVLAYLGRAVRHAFHTHGYRAAVLSLRARTPTSIWGRGACDAKGIIAAMIGAAEELLAPGVAASRCCSWSARSATAPGRIAAAHDPAASRYLINGEPTENKLALGSQGRAALRNDRARRMAHSAYPELGESAIEKLLDALRKSAASRCRRSRARPQHAEYRHHFGRPRAERHPGQSQSRTVSATGFRCRSHAPRFQRSRGGPRRGAGSLVGTGRTAQFSGRPAHTLVSFTTDIPAFAGTWGEPFLIGPGSIHVAHTLDEKIPKQQLTDAVGIYRTMVERLLAAIV